MAAVESKQVDPSAIERELMALWTAKSGPDGKAAMRACLLNLLVFAPDVSAGERARQVMADVLSRYPARAVLMIADREAGARAPGLEAGVSLNCELRAGGGEEVCGEQVTLTAKGPAILDLPGTVLPLLLPDVPVFLWWQAGNPFSHPIFDHLVRAVDRVIVDSLTFVEPLASLANVAQALANERFPAAIVDLGWSRLSPWRVLTAQIFDPPTIRSHLAQLERARITYAEGSPMLAWLFGGWLASRLGWKPTHQAPGLMRFEGGQTIEFSPAPAGEVDPGYFLGLHLLTRDGAAFEVARLPHACAATRLAVGDLKTERVVPMHYETLTEWLGRELNRLSRTPLFEAAVRLLAQTRRAPAAPQGPM